MASRRRVIQVLPLGQVRALDLTAAWRAIRSRIDCDGELVPPVFLPSHSFRSSRGQHDADKLLDFLFERLDPKVMRIIGVTAADLFAEGRNFVFGYAHMRDRIAVVSTHRLRELYWGRPDHEGLLGARIDKAVAHEIGHTFHVPHCENATCVMHHVEFLWQLDELGRDYCEGCASMVSAASCRGVDDPETLFQLAGSYMRRHRLVRAVATYAAATEGAPGNPHYHNDHGVALLAIGNRPGAARAFQRALELSPGSPQPYYNLGIVCRERGDVASADFFFGEALKREPDLPNGLRYLGILHQDHFFDPIRARHYLSRYQAVRRDDHEVARRLCALAGEDSDQVRGA
ncbi:MAG: tetratricopeptide repeat protein [Deltaproteobacteria bacterium]|nr:tetratricopeptide repeat protein [Deltaproteobacteria bacterium]